MLLRFVTHTARYKQTYENECKTSLDDAPVPVGVRCEFSRAGVLRSDHRALDKP
jgi:hypothetical protein